MKAILMSIRPEWVAKILNKTKTIEVRKRFPSDYVGWVYIYCTKARHYTDLLVNNVSQKLIFLNDMKAFYLDDFSRFEHLKMLNGKVVARFWCDKAEEINHTYLVSSRSYFIESCLTANQFSKECCLEQWELDEYLKGEKGTAIHISKLEIFDEPKRINEFYKYSDKFIEWYTSLPKRRVLTSLTRAPQSWCYVEVE